MRRPLVCSVLSPTPAIYTLHDCSGDGIHRTTTTSVRLRVKRLISPLPADSAIAPSFQAPLAGQGSDDTVRDPMTEVGVTPRCLLTLGIMSGGWARLSPAAPASTPPTPQTRCSRLETHRLGRVANDSEHQISEMQDEEHQGQTEQRVPVLGYYGNGTGRRSNNTASSTRSGNNRGQSKKGLLCRVVASSGDISSGETLKHDEILLPPSLAFNAGLGPFSLHVCLRPEHYRGPLLETHRPPPLPPPSSESVHNNCGNPGAQQLLLHRPPPVARAASVSTVKRPRPSGNGNVGGGGGNGHTAKQARAHALALTAFFSTPRILRVGDVFGVSIPCRSSSSNGTGCWWEEPPEDVRESGEEEEGPREYCLEDDDLLENDGRCSGAGEDAGDDGDDSDNGDDTRGQRRRRRRRRRQMEWRPRQQCSAEEQRFREAIVRHGSELAYFCVTGLDGEQSDGGGGGGGDGGEVSTDNNVLKSGAINVDRGRLQEASSMWSGGRIGGDGDGCGWLGDGEGENGDEGGTFGMVVSRSATALRQGGNVCSAVPESSWYHAFACRANGYPCPPLDPPLDERCVGRVVAALAPLVGPEAHRLVAARSRPAVLLHGPEAGETGRLVVEIAAQRLGFHVRTVTMHAVLGSAQHAMGGAGGGAGAGGALRQEFLAAKEASPCLLHLRDIASLTQAGSRAPPGSEEADERFAAALSTCLAELDHNQTAAASVDGRGGRMGAGVVLVGSSEDSLDRIPTHVRRCFTHEILAPLPSETLRVSLLCHHLLRGARVGSCVTPEALKGLGRRLVGRSASQIRKLVANAGGAALARSFGGQDADWLAIAEARELHQSAAPSGDSLAPSHRDTYHHHGLLDIGGLDTGGRGGDGEGEGHQEEDLLVTMRDLEAGEKDLPPPSSGTKMGYAKIPQVKWDDIGGLGSVKREILDVIELPLKHPEVFGKGVKRRAGILLYGPPGTGKTLLAKAVATECGLPFFSVKGPELLDVYVGESERNVREVFAQARMAAPCVLFFDELDSLAPARGRGGDSGGVMDRVVAQLLAELDGAAAASNGASDDEGQEGGEGGTRGRGTVGPGPGGTVFVIGATNRPDLLDPSLMRPGRFDRLLYLGVSGDRETQTKVLRAISRKFAFEEEGGDGEGIDLAGIVRDRIPPQFTGADLSAVASNALQLALRRKIAEIEEQVAQTNARELYLRPITPQQLLARFSREELAVKVSRGDLEAACLSVTPSVSKEELVHYERMKAQFSSSGIGGAGRGGA